MGFFILDLLLTAFTYWIGPYLYYENVLWRGYPTTKARYICFMFVYCFLVGFSMASIRVLLGDPDWQMRTAWSFWGIIYGYYFYHQLVKYERITSERVNKEDYVQCEEADDVEDVEPVSTVNNISNSNNNTKYCRYCGESINPSEGYCRYCGKKITITKESSSTKKEERPSTQSTDNYLFYYQPLSSSTGQPGTAIITTFDKEEPNSSDISSKSKDIEPPKKETGSSSLRSSLLEYKALYDEGLITLEEYDQKKKQLLEL